LLSHLPPFFHHFFRMCFFLLTIRATMYKLPFVLPQDPNPLQQFPCRKLHQILLCILARCFISFLSRWREKRMPEIHVINRRSGGRGTREAYWDCFGFGGKMEQVTHTPCHVSAGPIQTSQRSHSLYATPHSVLPFYTCF